VADVLSGDREPTGRLTQSWPAHPDQAGDLFDYDTLAQQATYRHQPNPYAFAFGLTLDPAGNVYVSDNPDVLAPPNNVAHVWKVNVGTTGPAQPALTSKPGNPTNNASPGVRVPVHQRRRDLPVLAGSDHHPGDGGQLHRRAPRGRPSAPWPTARGPSRSVPSTALA